MYMLILETTQQRWSCFVGYWEAHLTVLPYMDPSNLICPSSFLWAKRSNKPPLSWQSVRSARVSCFDGYHTISGEKSRLSTVDLKAPSMNPSIKLPGKIANLFVLEEFVNKRVSSYLVEAAIELAKKAEEFQLVLVGDGPMRADVEALISEHDMGSKISITGWATSDRVREELLDCTALVLPSFAEGLPVVIMEAMSLGRAGSDNLHCPGFLSW